MQRREPWLRLALLLGYAAIYSLFLPHWELRSDDGRALQAAENALSEFFFWGPRTSVGAWHLPFFYYYVGVFLKAGGTILAAQIGILLSHLAAHWLLIEAGKKTHSLAAGYTASLLAFTNPAFFQLSQRFWEPVLLPFFTTLALERLLAYAEKKRPRDLLISLFALACASSAHLNAVFLLPVYALVLAGLAGKELRNSVVALSCAALAFLPLLPFAEWAFVRSKWLHLLLLLGGFAGVSALLAKFLGRLPLRFSAAGSATALLAGLGVFVFVRAAVNPPLEALKLLDFFGAYALAYNSHGAYLPPWHLSPLAWLMVAYFACVVGKRSALGPAPLALALWLALPLFLLLFTAPFLRRFHMHWLVFLFPAAWLALALGLTSAFAWIRGPRLRVTALVASVAALVVLQASRTLDLAAFVERHGGVGERMATLGSKLAVMERISALSSRPAITLVLNRYYYWWDFDYDAWRFLARRFARERWREGESDTYFYLFQPRGNSPQRELWEEVSSRPGIAGEEVGPVSVYRGPQEVEGAGVKVWWQGKEGNP